VALGVALGALGVACHGSVDASERKPQPKEPVPSSRPVEAAPPAPPTAPARRADEPPPPEPDDRRAPPTITLAMATTTLFGSAVPPEAGACASLGADTKARVRCLVGARYAGHEKEKALALDLFDRFGTVVGQGEAETMDGGYRGTIRLRPTLPVGADQKHLVWLHDALVAIDDVMTKLEARAAQGPSPKRVAYRYAPVLVKFVRSLDGKRTPSGFANAWTYSYNVEGSLNTSAEAVRSLAVHEIFHLNDTTLGGGAWSHEALGADVRAIMARCKVPNQKAAGAATPCLRPYSPTPLEVRGGTFYAFQPGNDVVMEYAAELATRVFDEARVTLSGGRVATPFRCGPKENARAYAAMVDRFFAGMDLAPACPP
jgi:hypothetical protein